MTHPGPTRRRVGLDAQEDGLGPHPSNVSPVAAAYAIALSNGRAYSGGMRQNKSASRLGQSDYGAASWDEAPVHLSDGTTIGFDAQRNERAAEVSAGS